MSSKRGGSAEILQLKIKEFAELLEKLSETQEAEEAINKIGQRVNNSTSPTKANWLPFKCDNCSQVLGSLLEYNLHRRDEHDVFWCGTENCKCEAERGVEQADESDGQCQGSPVFVFKSHHEKAKHSLSAMQFLEHFLENSKNKQWETTVSELLKKYAYLVIPNREAEYIKRIQQHHSIEDEGDEAGAEKSKSKKKKASSATSKKSLKSTSPEKLQKSQVAEFNSEVDPNLPSSSKKHNKLTSAQNLHLSKRARKASMIFSDDENPSEMTPEQEPSEETLQLESADRPVSPREDPKKSTGNNQAATGELKSQFLKSTASATTAMTSSMSVHGASLSPKRLGLAKHIKLAVKGEDGTAGRVEPTLDIGKGGSTSPMKLRSRKVFLSEESGSGEVPVEDNVESQRKIEEDKAKSMREEVLTKAKDKEKEKENENKQKDKASKKSKKDESVAEKRKRGRPPKHRKSSHSKKAATSIENKDSNVNSDSAPDKNEEADDANENPADNLSITQAKMLEIEATLNQTDTNSKEASTALLKATSTIKEEEVEGSGNHQSKQEESEVLSQHDDQRSSSPGTNDLAQSKIEDESEPISLHQATHSQNPNQSPHPKSHSSEIFPPSTPPFFVTRSDPRPLDLHRLSKPQEEQSSQVRRKLSPQSGYQASRGGKTDTTDSAYNNSDSEGQSKRRTQKQAKKVKEEHEEAHGLADSFARADKVKVFGASTSISQGLADLSLKIKVEGVDTDLGGLGFGAEPDASQNKLGLASNDSDGAAGDAARTGSSRKPVGADRGGKFPNGKKKSSKFHQERPKGEFSLYNSHSTLGSVGSLAVALAPFGVSAGSITQSRDSSQPSQRPNVINLTEPSFTVTRQLNKEGSLVQALPYLGKRVHELEVDEQKEWSLVPVENTRVRVSVRYLARPDNDDFEILKSKYLTAKKRRVEFNEDQLESTCRLGYYHLRCHSCTRTVRFTKISDYLDHIDQHFKQALTEAKINPTQEYGCVLCGKVFYLKEAFYLHLARCHEYPIS